MEKSKLNSIVQKQIAASTEFWAGKPKLNQEELSAIDSFAKKKGKVLDDFFSNEDNIQKVEDLFAKSIKK